MNRNTKIVIFVLALLGLSISKNGYSENNAPDRIIQDMLPKDQGTITIDGLKMREYMKEKPIHEISAYKTVYSEHDNQVHITNLDMSLQSEKDELAKLSGEKAIFNESTKMGEIQGRVKYQTQSGDILTCELLKWDMKNDQIIVPGKFTISHGKQTLNASNLTTNISLNQGSMSNIQATGK